jgi:hypothetical protein
MQHSLGTHSLGRRGASANEGSALRFAVATANAFIDADNLLSMVLEIQFAVVLEQHPAHPFEFGADLCCWRRHRLKRLGRVGDEAKHVKRHSALCRTSSRALNECGRQIDAQGGDLPGRAAVLAQVAAKPSQCLK